MMRASRAFRSVISEARQSTAIISLKADLNQENLTALEQGLPNLLQHVGNIKDVFGLPCVVAINAFPTDTRAELGGALQSLDQIGLEGVLEQSGHRPLGLQVVGGEAHRGRPGGQDAGRAPGGRV